MAGTPLIKCVYLLWDCEPRSAQRRRLTLLQECVPQLLGLPLEGLAINIDDEYATVKSPAPKWYAGPEICAMASIWVGDIAISDQAATILRGANFTVACYQVDESIYRDYGDNRHSGPRHWADGQRSPGVLAVTLLTRPRRFSQEKWLRRWHGRMSPISEEIQPRQRYVRNVVKRRLTADALPFDGIVEEAWPSPEHIADPYLFYCAKNRWQLVKHVLMMLSAILGFHNILKFRTTTMSEYFIKSGAVIKDAPSGQAPSRGSPQMAKNIERGWNQ